MVFRKIGMNLSFSHLPVLLDEVIEGLNIKEDGIYVDGTVGGAGHSREILKRIPKGHLIGIDQDQAALNKANKVLSEVGDNFTLVHENYRNFDKVLKELGYDKVDGILLDIGVSSHQLDTVDRGFSYQFDGPLDMRMNQEQTLTAKTVVNTYSERELTQILREYGEERWAKRIAEFIIKARAEKPIESTGELVDIIKAAIPAGARKEGPHPATRTFQAIRIEVNQELDVLRESIEKMVDHLKIHGRIAIISFHSLEDRIVKNTYRDLYRDCICPPEFPVCQCDKVREIDIITRKPVTAREEELKQNHRARSAKLRIAEKIV